ncbi:MAG: LSU ribosomal protein L1p (L10Ae), partial [uncultured Solirubrobacteraceae bacterium]
QVHPDGHAGLHHGSRHQGGPDPHPQPGRGDGARGL